MDQETGQLITQLHNIIHKVHSSPAKRRQVFLDFTLSGYNTLKKNLSDHNTSIYHSLSFSPS